MYCWLKQMDKPPVLLVSAGIIVTVMYNYYSPHIYEYYSILSVEEYTYLLILIPLALVVLLKIIAKHGVIVEKPSIENIVAGLVSLGLSASFYSLTLLNPQYILQLSMISLVFFAWALLITVMNYDKWWIPLLILGLLLSLVPLPMSYIQGAAYSLTPVVTKAAAWLTGARIVETRVYTALRVIDKDGVSRTFRIAPVCSGITSLLSILSLLPLILYIVAESNDRWFRKLFYALISAFSSAAAVFIGNILRLSMIVWVARSMGYNEAIGAFHSFPSIIYVSAATIIGIFFITRLGVPGKRSPIIPHGIRKISRPRLHVPSTLLTSLLVVFMVLVAASSQYVSQPVPTVSFAEMLSNPSIIVFNQSRKTLVKSIPQPVIGEALGALDVRVISVRYRGRIYYGYLELAESPGRFHGWYVCLSAQGYRIEKSWSESIHGLVINYMVISREGRRLLLGYTIYKYPVSLGGREITMYVRTSLFAQAYRVNEKVDDIRGIFTSIGEGGKSRGTPLPFIALVMNGLIITGVIFFILSFLYKIGLLDRLVKTLIKSPVKY